MLGVDDLGPSSVKRLEILEVNVGQVHLGEAPDAKTLPHFDLLQAFDADSIEDELPLVAVAFPGSRVAQVVFEGLKVVDLLPADLLLLALAIAVGQGVKRDALELPAVALPLLESLVEVELLGLLRFLRGLELNPTFSQVQLKPSEDYLFLHFFKF